VDEERLAGGNTHAEVVRVGDTVRRPTGTWTPGVHRLLAHLEQHGYSGSPRVLGIDAEGREMLTYVGGVVVWPGGFWLVESDSALAEIGASIRAFHDATASFPGRDSFAWSDRGSDPGGPAEILCHNDLGPWNLIHGTDGSWTFIDWDLAAPGRRVWDLALALLSLTPLMPDRAIKDSRILERIEVFRAAYGTDLFPADVLAVAVERCQVEADRIERLAAMGTHPYVRLLDEGHAQVWREAAAHINVSARGWQAALMT
jgi:hypothetical protein